jgi:hypothetical protein
MKKIFIYLLLIFALSGCSNLHFVVRRPTVMIHGKGHDDAIGGVAISVRTKWDIFGN